MVSWLPEFICYVINSSISNHNLVCVSVKYLVISNDYNSACSIFASRLNINWNTLIDNIITSSQLTISQVTKATSY